MKTLITQVGTYLTGDATADALAQYWLALTEDHRADIVEIPVVSSEGDQSHVRLTLGTMLPIAIVDADLAPQLDDDEGAARRLLTRARMLTSAGPAFDPDELSDSFRDDYGSSLW